MVLSRAIANNIYTICGTPSLERRYPASRNGGFTAQEYSDYNFESHKELVPMQPGDVPVTFADTEPLERDYGFKPNTSLRDGLRKFAKWYKEFYLQ